MIRRVLLSSAVLMLAACGDETEVPEVETGEIDITVEEMVSPATWEIDREASSIRFRATQNDREFVGSFERWNAGIALNPEAPQEEGAIEALIDLSSADAGNSERNQALPGEDWFYTAMHPVAIFRSRNISATGEGAYQADGSLTIKGITEDVVMPFTLTIDETGRAVADGSVILDRSDFGVGAGEFADGKWVGLEVEVLLHMEAEPAG